MTRAGTRPRRWAPTPASPPSAPLGLGPWECRAAAGGHRPSGCTAAKPAADGTCRHAVQRRVRPADARPHTARRRPGSSHRPRPRRDSSSPAAMPPGGRHPSRSGPSGHGSGAPGIAWLRPRADVAIGARGQRTEVRRGDWNRSCRSCPGACLRGQRAHRRDPSLPSRCSSRGSTLLWSPRTPAAPRSISPSAYTSHAVLTRTAQTGLSCSGRLRVRVLRPVPRRDLPHVHLRTEARETWPSP